MAADQPKDSDEVLLPIDSPEDKTEEIKDEVSVEKSEKSIESMESHEQETKNRQRRQAQDVSKIPADQKKNQETVDDNTSESFSKESSEENKDKLVKPEESLQQQATNRQ